MRSKMPRPKGPNNTQVSINLPEEWVEELDKLAGALSQPGLVLVRADVIRMALRTGMDTLGKKARR
jgi:hypothetical protein